MEQFGPAHPAADEVGRGGLKAWWRDFLPRLSVGGVAVYALSSGARKSPRRAEGQKAAVQKITTSSVDCVTTLSKRGEEMPNLPPRTFGRRRQVAAAVVQEVDVGADQRANDLVADIEWVGKKRRRPYWRRKLSIVVPAISRVTTYRPLVSERVDLAHTLLVRPAAGFGAAPSRPRGGRGGSSRRASSRRRPGSADGIGETGRRSGWRRPRWPFMMFSDAAHEHVSGGCRRSAPRRRSGATKMSRALAHMMRPCAITTTVSATAITAIGQLGDVDEGDAELSGRGSSPPHAQAENLVERRQRLVEQALTRGLGSAPAPAKGRVAAGHQRRVGPATGQLSKAAPGQQPARSGMALGEPALRILR